MDLRRLTRPSTEDGPLQLGSFHQHLGLVSLKETPAGRAAREALAAGHPVAAEVQGDASVAFEVAGFIHELQHFFDIFGTAAGTSLVTNGLEWAAQFAGICDEADLMRARDPAWVATGEWLHERAAVLRGFRFALIAEKVFSRPFEPFEPEGHDDRLFAAVHHPSDGAPSRRCVDGIRRTVIEPLGFEAFTEASAHAHTRDVIDYAFPDVKLEGEFRNQLIPRDVGSEVHSVPYMTVDLIISRWFKDHGLKDFPRSLVHQAVDRVLGQAYFQSGKVGPGGVAVPMRPAGMELERLLDGLEPHGTIRDGIPLSPATVAAYLSMADKFDAGDDWDTVEGPRWFRAVRIWETWIAKHVTAPLLRLRASQEGTLINGNGVISKLSELVPVIVRNEKIVAIDMPPEVRNAWCTMLFLTSAMHQLASGDDVYCPRRFGLVPGLATASNMARRGTCLVNTELGCGATTGFLRDGQFDCLFEDVVRSSGIRSSTHAR